MPRIKNTPTARLTRRSIVALSLPVTLQLGAGFTPDELLHDRVLRVLDGARWADLHDTPLVKHPDPVGQLEDLGDLVAHHHRREAGLAVELAGEPGARVGQHPRDARGGVRGGAGATAPGPWPTAWPAGA